MPGTGQRRSTTRRLLHGIATSLLSLTVIAGASTVMATPASAATPTLTVALDTATGAFRGGASGALYGLYGPDVPTNNLRVPATFEPYGGRFLVHFTQHEVKEDSWPGSVVVIGFPGIAEARAWWDSPAYQEIAPLRSRHVQGDIVLVEGVPEGYDPTGSAKALRDALRTD